MTDLTELVPLAFQILRFKMLDAHRKSLRRGEYNQESVEDLPLADPGRRSGHAARSKTARRSAAGRVGSLGERCRELFKWKLEGKSFPEIQRLMGQKSINTIYTWDLRCRKQLLALMGDSWDI